MLLAFELLLSEAGGALSDGAGVPIDVLAEVDAALHSPLSSAAPSRGLLASAEEVPPAHSHTLARGPRLDFNMQAFVS